MPEARDKLTKEPEDSGRHPQLRSIRQENGGRGSAAVS